MRRRSSPGGNLRMLAALGILFLVGCALTLSGCPRPRASDPPTFVHQPNLNLEAQSRLFEEARDHLKGGRPHAAIRLLSNLIQRHPHSPLLPDMRYLLGRAYEQTGNLAGAEESYRALIKHTRTDDPKNRRLLTHARRRLTGLAPELERAGPRIFNGLLLAAQDVPEGPERGVWLASLRQSGISALVLEVGTRAGERSASPPQPSPDGQAKATDPPAAGVYFRTSWAPVVEDLVEQIVPLAKDRGIRVYAAVSLRRMAWLETEGGWNDVRFDPDAGQLDPSQALDLFHPGFQHYLGGLMIDLVESGVEGIVFRGDAPLGPLDGFSAHAMSEFERAFGFPVDPAALFDQHERGPTAAAHYPPEFWRWVGWRTRQHLAIMGKLATTMRHHRGTVRVGVEVHDTAITQPSLALVRYGEDAVETRRAGLDFLVVTMEEPDTAPDVHASVATTIAIGGDDDRPLTPLHRAIEVMGDARRVWSASHLPGGGDYAAQVSSSLAAARARLTAPVGLLYVPAQLALP